MNDFLGIFVRHSQRDYFVDNSPFGRFLPNGFADWATLASLGDTSGRDQEPRMCA
jgi:hypothetical protein